MSQCCSHNRHSTPPVVRRLSDLFWWCLTRYVGGVLILMAMVGVFALFTSPEPLNVVGYGLQMVLFLGVLYVIGRGIDRLAGARRR